MAEPREEAVRRVPSRAPGGGRSNAQWLAELRRDGSGNRAWADLRTYVRRGLGGALARRGLGDHELDDTVHDALLRILEHLDDFRGDSQFTTWAMAVAIRVAFAVLRRRRRELPLGDVDRTGGEVPARAPDAARLFDRRSVLAALHAAIGERLTDRQRTAVLGELAGVPSEELARRLATGRNALYKLHHDARRKLRHAIIEAGFSEDDVRRELAGGSET